MREKKPLQFAQDIQNEIERIRMDFGAFAGGVRCLFLIHRNKEGGETNNTKVKKYVTKNPKEFFEKVGIMLEMKRDSGLPYRIYSCVNARNMEKAIRQFKYEQLEADYYDEEQRHNFYFDIQNRWIGCLMQPKQKGESLFMFDVDNVDNSEALKALSGVDIVKAYRTKNGWHIVTTPFNHTLITLPKDTELKTDSLLLLAY